MPLTPVEWAHAVAVGDLAAAMACALSPSEIARRADVVAKLEAVMPLTKKGSKIKRAMEEEYGPKKGESVFYASANAGKIKGVHKGGKRKGKRK